MNLRPYLLGLAGALVIILGVNLALRVLQSPRHGRWSSCVLFGIMAAGFAGGVYIETRLPLRLAYAAISALGFYAIPATLLEWPGFRPPPDQDEEEGDAGDDA